MSNKHGSLRKCSIEGIPFRVRKDVDVSIKTNRIDKERIANGEGPGSQKITAVEPYAENVMLSVDSTEITMITEWANSLESQKVSLTLVDGTQYKAVCDISMGTYSSQEGQVTLKFWPVDDWTIFAA